MVTQGLYRQEKNEISNSHLVWDPNAATKKNIINCRAGRFKQASTHATKFAGQAEQPSSIWLLLVDSTVSALRQARFPEILRDYRFVVGALPRHAIVDSEDNRDSD